MRRFLGFVIAALSIANPTLADGPIAADLVLKGGLVVDGTGKLGEVGDVAIRGDRIAAVGSFSIPPGTRTLDVSGMVVAPGFIDLHTHSDEGIGQPKLRGNVNYLTQGVTTIVTGNCGGGPLDVKAYFHAIEAGGGAGANVIHLIPHGTLRRAILGNADRLADARELARMEAIVDREMEAGAWGLSTGLIYVPSRYGNTAELIALSRIVARHGGIYASHIRDEGPGLLASIDEAISIGREAKIPVHISHLKASGRKQWGLVKQACEKIAAARSEGLVVTADQYPYVASSTQLAAMVVPHWARQGSAADFARIAADRVRGIQLREAIQTELDDQDGGAAIRISRYAPKPGRVGRDLVAIARGEGTTPLEIVLDIERNGGAQAIDFAMSEADVREVMTHDFVATASDASTHLAGGGDQPHPRAYGTFPRKIRYALDEKVITLEQAVRSCTGLPAEILGMPDRGTIRAGSYADVIVFDPATFRDTATFDHPTQFATGLAYVFVNGKAEIERGKVRNKLAGRVLRPKTDGPADLIVSAGKIWTGDAEHPQAEAIACRNGRIVAVGSRADVESFRGRSTRVIDAPTGLVIPGLIDAHAHLNELGAEIEQVDLRGVNSPEEVAERVARWIKEHPGDGWILGRGWDQSLWPTREFSSAEVLDKVAPNRPVWLIRVDGHAGWANSQAMRRANVTTETKAPADGQILRNSDGEPSGVFIDGAMTLVHRAVPPPTREANVRRILEAQELCLKSGLTGIHDAGVSPEEAEVYRVLDRDGRLKLRVYGMALLPIDKAITHASNPPIPRKPGRKFEMRAMKVYIDGAMGSRGALLFEPYSDDPKNVGLQRCDPKDLQAITTVALKHGWQVCTHAIGDKGNALVLDAFAAARQAVPEARDPRLRIEHAQVVRKIDVERFRSLGVIASMQPSHSSSDMRWAEARPGPKRADGAYAWRWFLDAGVPLAFGSDFPVEVPDPPWGIYAAVTRQDRQGKPEGGWHPSQKLTREEALRAFTAGAAFAGFEEDRLGKIRVGMLADLTIFDRDLFTIEPAEILRAKVVATVVDGDVVYRSK